MRATSDGGRRRRAPVLAAIAAAALVAGAAGPGCALGRHYRGAAPPVERLREVKPGVTTKGDVLRLLGPPTHMSLSGVGTTFVYELEASKEGNLSVSAFRARVSYSKEELVREAVEVEFDKKGIVRTVATAGRDRPTLSPEPPVTETHGH